MKTSRLLPLFLLVLLFISICKKHINHPTDSNGLPPATQTSAHMLVFLLNGEVWMPSGNNENPRLFDNYDPFNNKSAANFIRLKLFKAHSLPIVATFKP